MAQASVLRTSASVFGGLFAITVATDNVEVAKEVCGTAKTLGQGLGQGLGVGLGIGLGLGAVYVAYNSLKPIIEGAVKKGVGGERDDQDVRNIRPGCLHFELHCFTDERFLEVLADYESGRMKERLQEELSLVGIKVEGLKVKIENMEEVNETRDAIKTRSRTKNISVSDIENLVISDVENDNKDKEAKVQTEIVNRGSVLESKQKAPEISVKQYGEDHPDTASSYENIGYEQNEMKDFKSALVSYKKALHIRLKLHGEDHPDTASSYNNIGCTQNKMKDFKSSRHSYRL
ncbi:uncharacterized protein LOC114536656 [Dendronephthya gigantea]|uniref:uncharacterized protein LOC114536656 n=1 Tax=Dendronephthya gigantea TaxID=151771 RepID=UPI00106B2982|nr:uncharacterized protein LOC114536656 [Dendronephthya gigantea]